MPNQTSACALQTEVLKKLINTSDSIRDELYELHYMCIYCS